MALVLGRENLDEREGRLKYRAEIDGLRAVAVIPVIFFHAGVSLFEGGFVGVDVFFVISGYLITTIILGEIAAGTFSLLSFYERRVRRILPVLFVVVLTCIPFAWVWLTPQDMKSFSSSLVAVATFSSNILFWRESGYFETAAEFKPLLHTWSLAVEEQYYIIFPVFLLGLFRFGKQAVVPTLVAVFVVSLGVAQWGAYNYPSAAFFLLPTRGWEILLGAFCAFYLEKNPTFSSVKKQIGATAGICLILFSIFLFDKSTPTPSLFMLLPTLGTVLIIVFARDGTFVRALLGSKVFVPLGLMSYSAYLWHQPLIAFARHRYFFRDGVLPTEAVVYIVSLCLFLSYLSWLLIEKPFRRIHVFKRKGAFLAIIGVWSVLISFGVLGRDTNGFSNRFENVIGLVDPVSGADHDCHGNGEKGCLLGNKEKPATVAIFGDSHSGVLHRALNEELNERNLAAFIVSNGWCVPFLGVEQNGNPRNPECKNITESTIQKIADDKNIRVVVLIAEWANYTKGNRSNRSDLAFYADSQSQETSLEENTAVFQRGFEATLSRLLEHEKKIVIVGPTPEFDFPVPRVLGMMHYSNTLKSNQASLSAADYQKRNAEVLKIFSHAQHADNVLFLNSYDVLCETYQCNPFEKGESLYVDENHLSYFGSKKIVRELFSNRWFFGE